MPDVMDMFPELKGADTSRVMQRRMELIAINPKEDIHLQELVVIARILRGRASAPKPTKAKPLVPSVDML
jgi:hypothetical protein